MGHGKYIDPFKAGDSLGLWPRNDNVTPSEASVSHHRVKAGEVLNLEYVVLPGESKDIDITIDLVGPGAEAHIKALYLCKADEKVNFHILMHHRAPGCRSRTTTLYSRIPPRWTPARSWKFMPMTSNVPTAQP